MSSKVETPSLLLNPLIDTSSVCPPIRCNSQAVKSASAPCLGCNDPAGRFANVDPHTCLNVDMPCFLNKATECGWLGLGKPLKCYACPMTGDYLKGGEGCLTYMNAKSKYDFDPAKMGTCRACEVVNWPKKTSADFC